MKKLLLIFTIILFTSCSKDDKETTMITADEYGVIIRGPGEAYTYKFFYEPTGDIFYQGEGTGDQTLFFTVSKKEIQNENVYFELQLDNEVAQEFEAYLISRKGDLYLNSQNNPAANSVFEMNNTTKGTSTLYGVIPVEMDQHFWVKNSEWTSSN